MPSRAWCPANTAHQRPCVIPHTAKECPLSAGCAWQDSSAPASVKVKCGCVEAPRATEYADPRCQQGNDHQQPSKICEATSHKAEAWLKQHRYGEQQRPGQEHDRPVALPGFAQTHVRLEKRQHHGKQSELDDVRVCRYFHGLVALKLAVIGERPVYGRRVVRGCTRSHLG